MNLELQNDLETLKKDIELYKESIKEVAEEIINVKISQHPIFIAHKDKLSIGELIFDHTELQTTWSISASTVEEFIEKKIIEYDKQGFFKSTYKDPQKFICVFLISKASVIFAFIPYDKI